MLCLMLLTRVLRCVRPLVVFSRHAPLWLGLLACERTDEASAARALGHARDLASVARRDVEEIRKGLPQGAQELARRWAAGGVNLIDDGAAAREALEQARAKVQDLRVAKSTFFALAAKDGRVARNDREQDLMAGVTLFGAFPALAEAANGRYVEALGVLPEAHGVRGKPDAEWLAAVGVDVGGEIRGLYVTGWSWSSYAFRLEFSLRGRVTTEVAGKRENVPLLYAFVLVGDSVYGSPEAPEVNSQAIASKRPLASLAADGSYSGLLEITGRRFALGVQVVPELAPQVAVGVLRSEI
jgi:hypothetical protein